MLTLYWWPVLLGVLWENSQAGATREVWNAGTRCHCYVKLLGTRSVSVLIILGRKWLVHVFILAGGIRERPIFCPLNRNGCVSCDCWITSMVYSEWEWKHFWCLVLTEWLQRLFFCRVATERIPGSAPCSRQCWRRTEMEGRGARKNQVRGRSNFFVADCMFINSFCTML